MLTKHISLILTHDMSIIIDYIILLYYLITIQEVLERLGVILPSADKDSVTLHNLHNSF